MEQRNVLEQEIVDSLLELTKEIAVAMIKGFQEIIQDIEKYEERSVE